MDAPAQEAKERRRYSVAHLKDAWYVACRSRTLGKKPLAITVLGTPLVVFRAENGAPAVLLDRCAHRNVPLSLGSVEQERLVCSYHGWEFDGSGACQKVPALCGVQTGKGRRVPAHVTRESQGYVWLWANPDSTPVGEPYQLPLRDEAGYTTVQYDASVAGTLHATLENILDVPHTAFLHRVCSAV